MTPLLTGRDYFVLAEVALENMDLSQAEQSIEKALSFTAESTEAAHKLRRRLQTELLHQQMKDLHT